MYDRFRDLETPGNNRSDVVLMATVTSFEGLTPPTRNDLKQFSELFAPLFRQAGRETRRMAVAALSRCPSIPGDVARLIAGEPIDVCAPLLVNSTALDDSALAQIIARGSAEHTRAIARRKALSQRMVATLAATGDRVVLRSLKVRRLLPAAHEQNEAEKLRLANEERLRERLRALVRERRPSASEGAGRRAMPRVGRDQLRRLVAFAEEREPLFFATALADMLDCSFQLAERIMLDISGRQLAETLTALGIAAETACVPLEAFFPHLAEDDNGVRKSELMLGGCNAEDAANRLVLWLRADRETNRAAAPAAQVADGRPSGRKDDPRTAGRIEFQPPIERRPLKRA